MSSYGKSSKLIRREMDLSRRLKKLEFIHLHTTANFI